MKFLFLICTFLFMTSAYAQFGNQRGPVESAHLTQLGGEYVIPTSKNASIVQLFARNNGVAGTGISFVYASQTAYQVPVGTQLRVFYLDCNNGDGVSAVNAAGMGYGPSALLTSAGFPAGSTTVGGDGAGNGMPLYNVFQASSLAQRGHQREGIALNFTIPEGKYPYLQILQGSAIYCVLWGKEE